MSFIGGYSIRQIAYKIKHRVIPNLRYLPQSQIRHCGACCRLTVMLAFGSGDEMRLCLRCRANLRYQMLAESIRFFYPDLTQAKVLELDFTSPLRRILSQAGTYTRSFYRDGVDPGATNSDGVVCQDITRLTFADNSLDLIVSSDVLEHVADADAAFRESARVLRSGGMHLFTVPPRPITRARALIRNGRIEHILPAEYHFDPLDPAQVLAFWDFGSDIDSVFGHNGLKFSAVNGPKGFDGRIVWQALKTT